MGVMLFHGVYRSAKHVVQLRPFEGWAFQKDMFTSGWCVVSHRRSEPHSPHCLGLRERNLTEILPLEASRLKASVTSLDLTNIFQCADRIGSPKIIHSRHSKRSSENILCVRSNKGWRGTTFVFVFTQDMEDFTAAMDAVNVDLDECPSWMI